MRELEQIEDEADRIAACASGENYSHTERKLASLISDLANHIADVQATIDEIIEERLAAAGIDMKPAYERMRKMVADRTEGR